MDFEDEIGGLFALRRRGLDGDAGAYSRIRERLATLLPGAVGAERARLLQMLGQVERDQGNRAEAVPVYDEAVTIWRKLDDRAGLAYALRHVADIRREAGDAEAALAEIDEALGLLDGADVLTRANAFRVQALCLEALGRPAQAVWRVAETLYAEAGIEAGVEECRRRLAG